MSRNMQLHCINTLLSKGQKIQVIVSEKKRKSLNSGDNLLDDSSGSLRKVSPLHGIQSAIYSTVLNHADYRNFTVTRSASMGVFFVTPSKEHKTTAVCPTLCNIL